MYEQKQDYIEIIVQGKDSSKEINSEVLEDIFKVCIRFDKWRNWIRILFQKISLNPWW